MVIAGLVFALLGLVFGWVPIVGWIFLIIATVLVAISYRNSNEKRVSLASLIVVILTWIYKIILVIVMFFSIYMMQKEMVTDMSDAFENTTITQSDGGIMVTSPGMKSIGDTVKSGDLEYVVNESESLFSVGNPDIQQDASEGNIFVALTYQLTNKGTEPVGFLDTPVLTLVNEDTEEVYQAEAKATSAYSVEKGIDESKLIDTLSPGALVEGTVVFEIPEDVYELDGLLLGIGGTEKVYIP